MTAPAPMIILPPWTIFLYYEFQKDFHPKAHGQFVQTKVLKVMKGLIFINWCHFLLSPFMQKIPIDNGRIDLTRQTE